MKHTFCFIITLDKKDVFRRWMQNVLICFLCLMDEHRSVQCSVCVKCQPTTLRGHFMCDVFKGTVCTSLAFQSCLVAAMSKEQVVFIFLFCIIWCVRYITYLMLMLAVLTIKLLMKVGWIAWHHQMFQVRQDGCGSTCYSQTHLKLFASATKGGEHHSFCLKHSWCW